MTYTESFLSFCHRRLVDDPIEFDVTKPRTSKFTMCFLPAQVRIYVHEMTFPKLCLTSFDGFK